MIDVDMKVPPIAVYVELGQNHSLFRFFMSFLSHSQTNHLENGGKNARAILHEGKGGNFDL